MAKLSKRAKEALSKVLNDVMRMVILPLFQWTADNQDAFFFIIIGNKHITDVAWYNSDGLTVDGALAVANDPNAAAVFEFIKTTYDIALEENVKDKDFNDAFQDHCLSSSSDKGWISAELED